MSETDENSIQNAPDLTTMVKLIQAGQFDNAWKTGQRLQAMLEAVPTQRFGPIRVPDVSIVIATWKDAPQLGLLLEALVLPAADASVEIHLVGSEVPDLPARARRYLSAFCCTSLPFNVGPSAARNLAARRCRGEVVLFVDDDGLCDADDVTCLASKVLEQGTIAARGRIVERHTTGQQPPLHYDLGPTCEYTPPSTEGFSAWRRDVFLALGGFDPAMFGHEGLELTDRALARYPCEAFGYCDKAILFHDFALDKEGLAKKTARHEAMNAYMAARGGSAEDVLERFRLRPSRAVQPRAEGQPKRLGQVARGPRHKPRNLILHCGPSKTGTSALQAHMRRAEIPGWLYPSTGQWEDGAHHRIVFAHAGRERFGNVQIAPFEEFQEQLKTEVAQVMPETVLFSSEALGAEQARRFVDDLQCTLGNGIKATVVISLRHPIERAAAAYNQAVRDSVAAETRLPDEFLAAEGGRFCLAEFVQEWGATPMQMRYVCYHPEADFVQRFCDAIGAPPPDGQVEWWNTSLTGVTLAAHLAANRCGIDAAARPPSLLGLPSDERQSSFPFSANATAAYLETLVAPDLRSLRAATGINLTELYTEPPKKLTLSSNSAEKLRLILANVAPHAEAVAAIDSVLESFSPNPDWLSRKFL